MRPKASAAATSTRWSRSSTTKVAGGRSLPISPPPTISTTASNPMAGTRTLSLQVAGNTACRRSILPNISSRLRRSKIPTRHGTRSSGPRLEVPGGETAVSVRVAGPDCGPGVRFWHHSAVRPSPDDVRSALLSGRATAGIQRRRLCRPRVRLWEESSPCPQYLKRNQTHSSHKLGCHPGESQAKAGAYRHRLLEYGPRLSSLSDSHIFVFGLHLDCASFDKLRMRGD